MMFINGTVSCHCKYEHVCNHTVPVNIGYNLNTFKVHENAMVEHDVHDHSRINRFEGVQSSQVYDWEILKSFFYDNNIVTTWTGLLQEDIENQVTPLLSPCAYADN